MIIDKRSKLPQRSLAVKEILAAFIITAFLWFLLGCKKNKEDYTCPEIASPTNHSIFHPGDTIPIRVYLPPSIQRDTGWAFAEFYINRHDLLKRDTLMYPIFGKDFYGTVKVVLKPGVRSYDSAYISTGLGGATGGLFCNGITIYVQP